VRKWITDIKSLEKGHIKSSIWAAVIIPDIEKGRVMVFVNCLNCGYYMFFKPEIVVIL